MNLRNDEESWPQAILATLVFVGLVVAFCGLVLMIAAATDTLP